DGHPTDERGGAFGLVSIHPRSLPGEARLGRLDKALPVRGDVPSIADGDEEGIRRVSDRLAELERGRFLSLDAVRIDAVDERRLALVGEGTHHRQRGVEPAPDSDNVSAVGDRLRELAGCDLAGRK